MCTAFKGVFIRDALVNVYNETYRDKYFLPEESESC